MNRRDRDSLLMLIAVLALLIGAMVQTSWSQTDGPAALPQRTPNTAIVSPNAPKTVSVTDNLQTMISGAVCGDTFLLDPALVYPGALTVPTLACDAQHGITIRSSATVLEDAKHRVIIGQQFPKIVVKGSQQVTGGAFVLWYGVEFTRVAGGTVYNLIDLTSSAHDQVFDHVYVHGTPTDETVRGIFLQGATNIVVQNSYFSDFHCRALGTCGDAQAISGGVSDVAGSGNYLFQNNYLEAAGENVMIGGGYDTMSPSDVTIQYNDIVKPASWNPADPSFGGQHWIAKNLVEFKNCVRCLVQGNRMIGSWGGYTQLGWAILVGVKNQGSATGGLCPLCVVSDITVRNNWVSRTGQAMQIMIAPAGGGYQAKEQERISVHDNVFDQLQYPECYQCGQWLIQLSSDSAAPSVMHDVTIANNTFSLAGWDRDGGFMTIGGPVGAKMYNIQITGNVFPGGKYPLYSTGGGAATNCFAAGTLNYAGALAGCWATSAFTGNVVLNNGNVSKIVWPMGNTVVNSGANVVSLKTSLATR